MLSRVIRSAPRLYKRNLPFITPLLYSTNNNNNKMEEVDPLAAKVEALSIQPPQPEVEQKGEPKQEGKKEKKAKAEKPKAEKKEEGEEKDEVGPKLFSQVDLRVSEIVECWKVTPPNLAP